MRQSVVKNISTVILFVFVIALFPMVAPAQAAVGKLRGFVYSKDGKEPLKNAIVLLRETTSERTFQSPKTKKNGAYVIEQVLPGTYAVGIQYEGKDYNVDALLKIEPKKQVVCFTVPKLDENEGKQIKCKSKGFFLTPVGIALAGIATAGIVYGVVKITEKETSPTTPTE